MTSLPYHCLIYESSLEGHRAYYVRVLADALLRLGCRVELAIPGDQRATTEWATFIEDLLPDCQWRNVASTGTVVSQSKQAHLRFDILVSTVEQVRPDHVYVPYADGISQAWGMRTRPERAFPEGVVIEGLMMRGGFAYPSQGSGSLIKTKVSYLAQKRASWDRVHFLDPIVWTSVRKHSGEFARRSRLIPEAIDFSPKLNHQTIRSKFSIPEEHPLVVSPGTVSSRKGVDQLIEAFATLPNSIPGRLLLLGRHGHEVIEQLRRYPNCPRVISEDRFATPQEFDALFAEASIVSVCYPRHIGSSSILLRAAKLGKPVLASNWGWIGWATNAFDLGLTCEGACVESVRNTLIQLLATEHRADEQSPRRQGLLDFHTTENHQNHWLALLRERQGLPLAPIVEFDSTTLSD